MKYLVIILFALICATAKGQPPRIDSMLISEKNLTLSVYGTFSTDSGTVTCQGDQLTILSWNTDIIVAKILDKSAGKIIVTDQKGLRDSSTITFLQGTLLLRYNGPSQEDDNISYTVRCDINSMLLHHIASRDIELHHSCTFKMYMYESRVSRGGYWTITSVSGEPVPVKYDLNFSSGFMAKAIISLSAKMLIIQCSDIQGFTQVVDKYYMSEKTYSNSSAFIRYNFNTFAPLNEDISIKDTSAKTNTIPDYDYTSKPIKNLFLPSSDLLLAINSPVLNFPFDSAKNISTSDIILLWDSLPNVSLYEIQYSSDEQFKLLVIDTFTNHSLLPLPPLEKSLTYFWRVRGINSLVKSKWSPTWSFRTGEKAAVATLRASNSYPSIYPNPSTGKVFIRYPELLNAHVLIYNLQGNIIYQTHLDQNGSAEWDASAMASGRYIIGLMSGSELRSAVVSIVK